MKRTLRLSMILGIVIALSLATPRITEAQFCYKCDLEYHPFTCTLGFPAFDPITGNNCQFIPGQWCQVWGSCFSESAGSTFIKEPAGVSLAGFFPGIDPRYLSPCASRGQHSAPLDSGGKRADIIAFIRMTLTRVLS